MKKIYLSLMLIGMLLQYLGLFMTMIVFKEMTLGFYFSIAIFLLGTLQGTSATLLFFNQPKLLKKGVLKNGSKKT